MTCMQMPDNLLELVCVPESSVPARPALAPFPNPRSPPHLDSTSPPNHPHPLERLVLHIPPHPELVHSQAGERLVLYRETQGECGVGNGLALRRRP